VGARCLYYRREDPTARAGSGRDHYQIILSSVGMLDDAAECGPDGHGADGVHKLVEDDVTVDAIMCCKRCTKDTHPHVTELHGGHDVLDSRLACISVTTQERIATQFAPALSAFMARAQASANRLFVF
jgi:hypothetical protein